MICGHVRKFPTLSMFWTMSLLALALHYIEKLYVFQWILIVLLLKYLVLFYYDIDITFSLSDNN